MSDPAGGTHLLALPRGRFLDLSRAPLVMGILNCTPDSFYPGSRAAGIDAAVSAARAMIAWGADIIDIGGESTRPGSDYVAADEELERVIPVVEAVRSFSDLPISVDTRKAVVASRALAAGADVVNDVSALRDDPELMGVVAGAGVPVVLMHMRGTPKDMQEHPSYVDTVREVCGELALFADRALAGGVRREQIILDPGIGFGKRDEDNLRLLAGIPSIRRMGYPVLVGLSRKGFIGRLTGGRPVGERLAGSLAANVYAALFGAAILRAHDVAETVDACRILRAIRGAAYE